MDAVPLDLTPLRKACTALEESLQYLRSDLARDPGLRRQFRAAAIQAFEFTYDIAYKMLTRQLEQISENPSEIDRLTYMQLIRAAAEAGLVTNVQGFQIYRDRRNITSHAYDERKADQVLAILADFATDARALLAELERRNTSAPP
jgi:nucleotidyltransferase substrate binding protein (TIGR01987 family)